MLRSTIMAHAKENKNKNNFRFKQLQDIEKGIPWKDLIEVVSPHYFDANIGRLLVSAESMLRIYFLQLQYGMSAEGVERALFQVNEFREFALIDLDRGVIPNDSCIEDFNSLLVEKSLSSKIEPAFNFKPITTD